MNMTEAFDKFRNYFNFVQPQSVYELEMLDRRMIDTAIHGKANRMHVDGLGQLIRIGDLVAYSSKKRGTCTGIVLGYTDQGYRIARIYKDPHMDYFYCSDLETPFGATVLIKSNKAN